MLLEDVLQEARKNPGQNPKIDPYFYLQKYKNQSDIYVSFTKIPKLGINPQSIYKSTPIGIFAYPIDYVLMRGEKSQTLYNQMPYASDGKYIQVLRARGRKLELAHITHQDITETFTIFRQVLADLKYTNQRIEELVEFAIDYAKQFTQMNHKSSNSVAQEWWSSTNAMTYVLNPSARNSVKLMVRKWNHFLRYLGLDYIIDDGESLINATEPTQTLFLSSNGYKLIDMVSNISPRSPA